jgi:hypothetical protein
MHWFKLTPFCLSELIRMVFITIFLLYLLSYRLECVIIHKLFDDLCHLLVFLFFNQLHLIWYRGEKLL